MFSITIKYLGKYTSHKAIFYGTSKNEIARNILSSSLIQYIYNLGYKYTGKSELEPDFQTLCDIEEFNTSNYNKKGFIHNGYTCFQIKIMDCVHIPDAKKLTFKKRLFNKLFKK